MLEKTKKEIAKENDKIKTNKENKKDETNRIKFEINIQSNKKYYFVINNEKEWIYKFINDKIILLKNKNEK